MMPIINYSFFVRDIAFRKNGFNTDLPILNSSNFRWLKNDDDAV